MNLYILGILICIGVGLGLYPLRKIKIFYRLLLGLFLTISVGLLYWYCGSWQLWQKHQISLQQTKQVRQLLASQHGVDSIILRLQQQLKQSPNDAHGWFLLGRLFFSQNKFHAAHQAFQHAHALQPEDLKIILNDARSISMLNNQRLDQENRKLLQDLLLKDPQQPDALMLLAMDAYRNTDYQTAINLWQKLLKLLPEQSIEAQELRQAIAQAFAKIQN